MTTIVLEFRRRGAVKELFRMERENRFPTELLLEGPAGTGKSRGIGEFLYKMTQKYPGTRGAILRKTRVSLTESFLVTWEGEVLLPDDPALTGVSRAHRSSYIWPNGTEVWTGGLDNPTRLYSAQFDWIYVQEATELTLDEWERLGRALRNHKMPFQFLIADCNPDAPGHWLNQRCEQGKMARLLSRHKDNPSIRPEYLARLANLTGVRRRRLYLGEWCSAEGAVWENFDRDIHIIDVQADRNGHPDYRALGLKDFIGSMDWGYSAPGVLQVWGRDGDKRMVRVAEVYRTKQSAEWWAERIADLDDEFSLLRVKADPSRNDLIDEVNDWLVKLGHARLVEAADNTKASSSKGDLSGLDLVRWGFDKDETGVPRLRLLRNALRFGRDEDRLAESMPICTEQEIPEYVFEQTESGEKRTDRTDDDCEDHGCDAMRYACAENWKRRAPIEPTVPAYKPRTLGHILDHSKEYKRKRRFA